jgi:hypothetical protein
MYLHRVGWALSVLFNVVLGGSVYQPFSARNWQWKRDGKINLVWLIDLTTSKGHCARSWAWWRPTVK